MNIVGRVWLDDWGLSTGRLIREDCYCNVIVKETIDQSIDHRISRKLKVNKGAINGLVYPEVGPVGFAPDVLWITTQSRE